MLAARTNEKEPIEAAVGIRMGLVFEGMVCEGKPKGKPKTGKTKDGLVALQGHQRKTPTNPKK